MSGRKAYAVLVVEDDPLLLADGVDLIEDAGFTAYQAPDADRAIALMEQHPDIRVLFTDIDMPGTMDGLKLAHYVRERWPPVVIIVTSGLQNVALSDMPSDGFYFAKPYSPASVLRTVNEAAASAGF